VKHNDVKSICGMSIGSWRTCVCQSLRSLCLGSSGQFWGLGKKDERTNLEPR
jgi:hypothetical protein